MTQILETTMLLCFGCSWPISLYRNYRAGTARNMSLGFILLILSGYIAGILAKLLSGTGGYVLVVYAANLLTVGANLWVYFLNHARDRKQNAKEIEKGDWRVEIESAETRCRVEEYKKRNMSAEQQGIVLFGGEYFSEIPMDDLLTYMCPELPVYNRSIRGLRTRESGTILETCVLPLCPKKVFLNLGEADAEMDVTEWINQYRWILYCLHSMSKAKLYIVSLSQSMAEQNRRLRMLAEETGCTYIEAEEGRLFQELRHYARCHAMTFEEAMSYKSLA